MGLVTSAGAFSANRPPRRVLVWATLGAGVRPAQLVTGNVLGTPEGIARIQDLVAVAPARKGGRPVVKRANNYDIEWFG